MTMNPQTVITANRAHVTVPFDLAAAEGDSGWRQRLDWPLPQASRRQIIEGVAESVTRELAQLDEGPIRDTGLVACPGLLLTAATLSGAAALLAAARGRGIRVAGGPPELAALSGDAAGGAAFTPGAYLPQPRVRFPALRRLVRTASWSTPWNLARALTRPDVVVLGHNALLRSYARRNGTAAWYCPPDQLMARVAVPAMKQDTAALADLAALLAACAARSAGLEGDASRRLEQALTGRFAPLLADAAGALARARQVRLPRAVWAGALSAPHMRALALAARQIGAEVTLFDHGGGTAIGLPSPVRSVRDHSLADRMVLATPKAADATASEWGKMPDPWRPRTRLIGAAGESTMRRVPLRRKAAPAARPRVLYLPTPMLGFRELLPPLLPDPVALDWQLRLAEMLKKLPADVLARPHPEGALPGARHPVSGVLPLAAGAYTKVVQSIDRFVFEYPLSTAFWEALCTDRPVILIELGLADLSETMQEIVTRRCHLVPTYYDECNLPQVDFDTLSEAVCGGADEADPSEIRSLLIGDDRA